MPLHLRAAPAGSHLTAGLLIMRGYDGNDSVGRPNRVNRAEVHIADGSKWAVFELAPPIPAGPSGGPITFPPPQSYGPPGKLPPGVSLAPTDDVAEYGKSFNVDGYWVDVSVRGYTAQEMTATVAGLSVRGDGRNPSTWPEGLVG
jgi:hypothetical protein